MPMNLTGSFMVWRTATPPLAVPSSLVSTATLPSFSLFLRTILIVSVVPDLGD